MIDLSERTIELVAALFTGEQATQAEQILMYECADNIPFCEQNDKFQMERIRFSVLKLSEGRMDRLKEAVKLAQTDWRDLFVAAGFGYDPHAHKEWAP